MNDDNPEGRVVYVPIADLDYLERVRVHQIANGLDSTDKGVMLAGLVALDNLVRLAFEDEAGDGPEAEVYRRIAERVLRQIGIVQSGRAKPDSHS